jgi:predicted transcriptional regulator
MDAVPRRPHVAIMLRVPPELGARLQAVAERERRSVTAQVVYALEQWLAQDERAQRAQQAQEGAAGADHR